jgi:hypothetical protein
MAVSCIAGVHAGLKVREFTLPLSHRAGRDRGSQRADCPYPLSGETHLRHAWINGYDLTAAEQPD